ncbi:hypothetical protein [Ruegeria sp. HKCCD8929]|uniref:hypothetical protein n=1 Tax=Ruegeria sp. HKCCD8929 TaxID=2683006 RepID=UPI001489795F|nr:hypothetical protein [Ruegeria sp. HKCCD8929]
MVRQIQNETGRYAFGVSVDEISSRYNFISGQDARNFFENLAILNPELLQGVEPDAPLESLVVNLQLADKDATVRKAGEVYKRKAETLSVFIRNAPQETVKIIVGPTGSGKTAFSKGLFTAGVVEFWSSKVVPSRIEYRWSHDYELDDYVFYAAARDLISYVCIGASANEFDLLIEPFRETQFSRELENLRNQGENIDYIDETPWLGEFSKVVRNWLGSVDPEEYQALVERAIYQLGIKFVFSFDGFDAVSPLEAFNGQQISEPVAKLCEFLDRSLISQKSKRVFLTNANAHFLIYIRDTTLSIVQRKLTRNPVGRRVTDFNWVCPPSYRSVGTIITRRICGDRVASSERREFVNAIVSSLSSHISRYLPEIERRPISSLFSWNVRNMKAHFGRLLIILFNRLTHDNEVFRQRVIEAGVQRRIFDEFVEGLTRESIRDYEVGRSLVFQAHSKEIGCRIYLSSAHLGKCLEGDEFPPDVIGAMDVQLDDGSVGDLIFNGFVDASFSVSVERISIAPYMLLGRLATSKRGYVTAAILHKFLVSVGTVEQDIEGLRLTEFLLGWMTIVGLVVPVTQFGNVAPRDRAFRITPCGRFLINGSAFRVSYLDSASFAGYWPDSLVVEGGFRSANTTFLEATLLAVVNACHLLEHLLEIEKDTLKTMKENSRSAWRKYKDLRPSMADYGRALLEECQSIVISARHTGSNPIEVAEATKSFQSLKASLG